MNIAIISHNLAQFRGGSKVALMLGKELTKLKHNVAYVCVYENIKVLNKKFNTEHKYKVYSAKESFLGNRIINFSMIWNIFSPFKKMYSEFKPDVVIEIGGVMTSLIQPVVMKIPTIYYCYCPNSRFAEVNLYPTTKLERIYLRSLAFIEKVLIKKIDKVLSQCSKTKVYLREDWGIEAENAYPPVDTNIFKPSSLKKDIILSVCKYEPLYKLEELIKIFWELKNKNFELHFVAQVDGFNPYLEKLIKLSKKDKRIHFHKNLPVNELKPLYERAKIFWHSTWSYYGLIIAEAQSCGIPSISFGREHGPGEIIIDGKTGYLVDSFREMYEKTEKLLSDKKLYNEMSIAARRNAIKRLSIKPFMDSFLHTINHVTK